MAVPYIWDNAWVPILRHFRIDTSHERIPLMRIVSQLFLISPMRWNGNMVRDVLDSRISI